MNCERNERLDRCLRVAMERDCCRIAELFDSVDTSDVRRHPRMDRLVRQAIRQGGARSQRHSAAVVRRVLLYAAVLALALCLLTVSITASRGDGVWNAVVEWYEQNIRLHFFEEPEQPAPDGDVAVLAPTHLQRMYLPSAYEGDIQCKLVDLDVNHHRSVGYEFYRDNTPVCYYRQSTLDEPIYPMDVDRYERKRVTVNGSFGEYFKHPTNGTLSLIWTDDSYYFLLRSDYLTEEDLMRWAESLVPAENAFGEEMQKINKPTALPDELVERISYTDPYHQSIAYYKGRHLMLTFSQTPFERKDGVQRYASAGYDEGTRFAYTTVGNRIAKIQQTPGGALLLYWTDGEYRYSLVTTQYTAQELVKIAESVRCVSVGPFRLDLIYIPKAADDSLAIEVEEHSETRYEQRYYRDHRRVCTYIQQILSEDLPSVYGTYTEQSISIHYNEGTLRTYESGECMLIWSDGSYRYLLQSKQLTTAELLSWAMSVCPPPTLQTLCKPQATDGLGRAQVSRTESAVTDVYCNAAGDTAFFTQSVLWSSMGSYDAASAMTDVFINDHPGVLLRTPEGEHILTWSDGSYRYELRSESMTTELLLQLARSTAPVPVPSVWEKIVPSQIETIRYPQLARSLGWEATVEDDCYDAYELEYTKNGEYIGRFVQTTVDGIYDGSITSDRTIEYVYGERVVHVCIDADGTAIVAWCDGEYAYRLEMPEQYVSLIPALITTMISEQSSP